VADLSPFMLLYLDATDEELPRLLLILFIQISAVGLILREVLTKFPVNNFRNNNATL